MDNITTANNIVNYFMHRGAVISKKDFDWVMDELGADKPMNDKVEEYRKSDKYPCEG
jgi:hypothetical protein